MANNSQFAGWKLVDGRTRRDVSTPCVRKDFRNECGNVIGISRLPGGASTGRITVLTLDGFTHEYFPSVYGLEIVKVSR